MLKILDRYILRKFLGTFVYSISLITIIVIVFDISEKVEDFISNKVALQSIIFDFYIYFIPFFLNLFSPLFTFIAVIFFTSKMAYQTEIVAILSSGISFKRILRPYMIGAAIIATSSLLLNTLIIPFANKHRFKFEEKYIRKRHVNNENNIHLKISKNDFIYVERYDTYDNTGYRFSMERYENEKLKIKLNSEFARWDSVTHKWQIKNYVIREINGLDETLITGNKLDTALNLTPEDFGRKLENTETMNYMELINYIKSEREKGAEGIENHEVELHRRISFPFATFILTLIGVAMSSRKVRGGIGLHIGLGLLISFSYILFMQVSTTFALSGIISPFVSVWIPNILYGILSFYLLKTAPK